jgi:hypothetical protein
MAVVNCGCKVKFAGRVNMRVSLRRKSVQTFAWVMESYRVVWVVWACSKGVSFLEETRTERIAAGSGASTIAAAERQ